MAKAYGTARYLYDFATYEEYAAKFHVWDDIKDPYIRQDDPRLEVYANMQTLNAFFEGVGVLVKKGLVDIDLVEDLLSRRIIWYWDKTKPIATRA
jgi:hypothetical protein